MEFDGSIKIDTRINTSSVPASMKKIKAAATDAFNNILFQTVKVGSKIRDTFDKIRANVSASFKKLLAGIFILFALSLAKIFAGLRESLNDAFTLRGGDTVKQIDGIKNQFEELKVGIALAFLPLIETALPYIKIVLSWLIDLFNRVAMITAAFAGQKEVLQVVAGSAAKLAENTKKAEKAARGALAAFDQIDVLQRKSDTDPNAPPVDAQMIPITNEILAKVQTIKDIIASWWNDPIENAKALLRNLIGWILEHVINPLKKWWSDLWAGTVFEKLWTIFKETFKNIVINALETFLNIKENILKVLNGISEFLTGVFTGNWQLAWQGIKDVVSGVFGVIFELIKGVVNGILILIGGWVDAIKVVWSTVAGWFIEHVLLPLQNGFTTVLTFIKKVFADTFTNIIEPLKGHFDSALNAIKAKFETIFNGIKMFVKGAINGIIDFINGMIQAVVGGINAVINAANGVGSLIPGFEPLSNVSAPQIPHLATGAVIPPNSRFLAVLGDQKSGRNIEAPEELIRQIVREESGSTGGEITVPIVLTLDGDVVYKNQKRVSTRHGKSLLSGGNA